MQDNAFYFTGQAQLKTMGIIQKWVHIKVET